MNNRRNFIRKVGSLTGMLAVAPALKSSFANHIQMANDHIQMANDGKI